MKPVCETKVQYLGSKYFLLTYLDTPEIKDCCGVHFIDGVKKMIREHIEPYKDNICYYRRKHCRHFGEYSNSAH